MAVDFVKTGTPVIRQDVTAAPPVAVHCVTLTLTGLEGATARLLAVPAAVLLMVPQTLATVTLMVTVALLPRSPRGETVGVHPPTGRHFAPADREQRDDLGFLRE